ncbi:hypothetical protein N9U73_02220 [Candidatus Pelagibacter bacterium]|nr:hypothetical protein [Candidatus Pelagibacter bacterium]
MKKIITIIFLIKLISIPVHAESIKDIEIEGISIGDSALKYFDEELIKMSSHKIPRTDNKYVFAAIYDNRFGEYSNTSKFKYKIYDVIEIYWLKNDKNYTIEVLAGALSKNVGKSFSSEKECVSLKENIFDEIKPIYPDAKVIRRDEPAAVDATGKSMSYRTGLKIDPKSKFYEVEISCIYYKGKIAETYESSAGVVIKTDKYNDWLMKQVLVN